MRWLLAVLFTLVLAASGWFLANRLTQDHADAAACPCTGSTGMTLLPGAPTTAMTTAKVPATTTDPTVFAPPAGAVNVRTQVGADVPTQIENALAAASRTYTTADLATYGIDVKAVTNHWGKLAGPTEAMRVAWIPFDPASDENADTNVLDIPRPVVLDSNQLVVVDSGVTLRWTGLQPTDTDRNIWRPADTFHDGGWTVGDTSHNVGVGAHGWAEGKFLIDLTGANDQTKRTFVRARGAVKRVVLQGYYTKSPFQMGDTATAAVVTHSSIQGNATTGPANWLIRNVGNEGSAEGWGPTQLTALSDSYIENLRSQGGVTLRFETDGVASGIHNVEATEIISENARGTVTLSPWNVDSDHVWITDIRSISSQFLIRSAATGNPGFVFTTTIVTGGCAVPNLNAQLNVLSMQMVTVYDNSAKAGSDVTVSDMTAPAESPEKSAITRCSERP